MVSALKHPFGVNKDVSDILNIPDFVHAFADFKQQCEKVERQPDVSCQFSPLIS